MFKSRYSLLIVALVLIAVLVIGMIVYAALSVGEEPEPFEIFEDVAPINYATGENAFHLLNFRTSFRTFIAGMDGYIDTQKLCDGLISALSKARVPGEKLGKIGSALTSHKNDINWDVKINEENLVEFFQRTTVAYISTFLNGFFAETTLTEEEFARFLYFYLSEQSTGTYREVLSRISQEDFTVFFGNTFYLLSTATKIKESGGGSIGAHTLSSAFYELGKNYIRIVDKVGLDTIQTLMGLSWTFTGDSENAVLARSEAKKIEGLIGYVFVILGGTMVRTDASDIQSLYSYLDAEGRTKTDYLIYSQSLMAKNIYAGLSESFRYADQTGINTADVAFLKYREAFLAAESIRCLFQGIEVAEGRAESIETAFQKTSESLIFFAEREYSLAEITAMEDGAQYQALLKQAKGLWAIEDELNMFVSNLLYLWMMNVVSGGHLEVS